MSILATIRNTESNTLVNVEPATYPPALFVRLPDGTDLDALNATIAPPAQLSFAASSGPIYELWNKNEALDPAEVANLSAEKLARALPIDLKKLAEDIEKAVTA